MDFQEKYFRTFTVKKISQVIKQLKQCDSHEIGQETNKIQQQWCVAGQRKGELSHHLKVRPLTSRRNTTAMRHTLTHCTVIDGWRSGPLFLIFSSFIYKKLFFGPFRLTQVQLTGVLLHLLVLNLSKTTVFYFDLCKLPFPKIEKLKINC